MDRVRALLAGDDEQREGLRALGGLLLGIGMLLVFFRRGYPFFEGEPWGDGALFVVLLMPCVFLYGAGFLGAREAGAGRPWSAVYLVFGILLAPLVLFQLLEWLGGSTEAPLNVAWIFLVTAGLAEAAAYFAHLRYGLLIAGLAAVIAWLALWDELLDDGVFADFGTLRGLLVIIAAILVAGAYVVWRLDRRGSWPFGIAPDPLGSRGGELLTAGAVAAVGAGAVSLGAFPGLFAPITPFAAPEDAGGFLSAPVEASLLWDAELLVASVLAVGAGSWLGIRGPVYVGAIGILFFVLVVGFDLDDSSPEGSLLGWPLVLLVLGALAVVASFFSRLQVDRLRPGGAQPPPASPPPAAPPPPPPSPGQP